VHYLAEGPNITVHGDLNVRNVVNCIGVFKFENKVVFTNERGRGLLDNKTWNLII